MRSKIFARVLGGILICVMVLLGSISSLDCLVFAEEEKLSNGTYSINGILKSATSNQTSMGNAAIIKPMEIIVDGDNITLKMECKALTTSLGNADFTGYLAYLNYFPDWDGGSSGTALPKNEVPVKASVKSYYQNVYDKYNDPKTGIDLNVKGKLYPRFITMAVKKGQKEIWVQLYVPVMEEISAGSGLQYARLQLDWDTLKQTGTEVPEDEDVKEEIQPSVEKETSSETSTEKNTQKLNVKSLEDGIYSVSGKMLKTDKETKSMADQAVGNIIKLTIKNGKYYLTLDFKGIEINKQLGYLSKLRYFASGYSTDSYGAPQGTVKNVSINSYQKDSKGHLVSDKFGTNYPDKVTFPLIKEALNDGFVPLQVFVPIMESISPGSGTQVLFLKLDWSTLKVESDQSVFKDTEGISYSSSSGKSESTGSSLNVGIGNLRIPSSDLKHTLTSMSDIMHKNDDLQNMKMETVTEARSLDPEDSSSMVMPSVISVLASFAGILYKGKSRGFF